MSCTKLYAIVILYFLCLSWRTSISLLCLSCYANAADVLWYAKVLTPLLASSLQEVVDCERARAVVYGQWGFGCMQVQEQGQQQQQVQQQQQRGSAVLLIGPRGVGKKTVAKVLYCNTVLQYCIVMLLALLKKMEDGEGGRKRLPPPSAHTFFFASMCPFEMMMSLLGFLGRFVYAYVITSHIFSLNSIRPWDSKWASLLSSSTAPSSSTSVHLYIP